MTNPVNNDAGNDPEFMDAFQRVRQIIELATLAGCKAVDHNQAYMVMMAANAATCTLQILASLVNNTNSDNLRETTDDDRRFAAEFILTISAGSKRDTTAFHFQPSSILDALNKFQEVTGRNPDSFLRPDMVAASRAVESFGTAPLAEFMTKRPHGTTH